MPNANTHAAIIDQRVIAIGLGIRLNTASSPGFRERHRGNVKIAVSIFGSQ
jgi:hypothetical protein